MLKDKKWNLITISPELNRVYFKLYLADNNKYPIKLWYYKNSIFYCERIREKHLLYKINSYWFNYQLLSYLKDMYWNIKIEVTEHINISTKYSYAFVDDILQYKHFKNYLSDWYELQVFYPLDKFHNVLTS